MSNFILLQKTRLAKMVEEYLTLKARGINPPLSEGGSLVQIISSNPFEICDSNNNIQVRDPSSIIEELKKVNSNINLLSMKGALILLKKWTFETLYISVSNEIKLYMKIDEVEYIDGIGTAEISTTTSPVYSVTSLQNKFKRLKKYLISQEFDALHPIDGAIDIIEEDIFRSSEGVRKADLRPQALESVNLDHKDDPFLLWSNEMCGGKSSLGKSQMSQLSQVSDFDVLSINSATQSKFDRSKSKPSFPKKAFQSLPVDNPFSLNLDLLSSQPLIGNIEDTGECDLEEVEAAEKGAQKLPIFGGEEEKEHKEPVYIDIIELTQKSANKTPDKNRKGNSEKSTNEGEEVNSDMGNVAVVEIKSPDNNLKRNFHDMIRQNKLTTVIDSPQHKLKKLKYQWGPNHKSEQQSFIKNLEGRRSLGHASSEMDTLALLSHVPAEPKVPKSVQRSNESSRKIIEEPVDNNSDEIQEEQSGLSNQMYQRESNRDEEEVYFTDCNSFGFEHQQRKDSSKRSTQSFGFLDRDRFVTVRKGKPDRGFDRGTEKLWSFGRLEESPQFAQPDFSKSTPNGQEEIKEPKARIIRHLQNNTNSNNGKKSVINLDDEEEYYNDHKKDTRQRPPRENHPSAMLEQFHNEKTRKKPLQENVLDFGHDFQQPQFNHENTRRKQIQEENLGFWNDAETSRTPAFKTRVEKEVKHKPITEFVDFIDLTNNSDRKKQSAMQIPIFKPVQHNNSVYHDKHAANTTFAGRHVEKPILLDTAKKPAVKSAKFIPDPFNPNKTININEFKSIGGKPKKSKPSIQISYNNFKQKTKPPIEIS